LEPGASGAHDVYFASPDGDEDLDADVVTATVDIPAVRAASNACVVLQHGFADNRSGYWTADWITRYSAELTARGLVTFSIDARAHASRKGVRILEDGSATSDQGPSQKAHQPAGLVDLVTDTVVDVRRGLDWLDDQVGCDQVAIVGHSMGGWIATITAAADDRVD